MMYFPASKFHSIGPKVTYICAKHQLLKEKRTVLKEEVWALSNETYYYDSHRQSCDQGINIHITLMLLPLFYWHVLTSGVPFN